MQPKSLPEYRWTSLAEAWDHGLEDMVALHAAEIPSGLPLDVDWPQYRKMERIGAFRPIGAFLGRQMVGYSAFFVQPTLQHKGSVQAINDVLYLEPEARRGMAGVLLITRAERMLRELGARRIVYFSHPSSNAKLSDLLRRLGYEHVESAHAKML